MRQYMTTLENLTVEQLRKAVAIKEQIESLQGEIEAIAGGGSAAPELPKRRGRPKMSYAERGRIAAAARWGNVTAAKAAPKKRRKVSAAGRARMAAAAKARWAKRRAGL